MHKAFTLVETVVSIGIFSVVIIMGTLMMVATLRASKKASAVALIRNEGSSALNIMTSYIRYASALDCTSAPSSISITPSNGDQIIFDCKTDNTFFESLTYLVSFVKLVSSLLICEVFQIEDTIAITDILD